MGWNGAKHAAELDRTCADVGFFSAFVAACWGQRPVVVRNAFPEPMIGKERAFAALVAASEHFRASTDAPQLRVNVDGGFLLADMDERLPVSSDGDVDTYARRVQPWLAGRPFLVTLNDYHRYDLPFWRRLRHWLRGLYEHVGVPSGGFLPNLWFGMYERTPFGIHTDHAETFAYVVSGTKRILVWPYECFADSRKYVTTGGEHLGTTRYEPHLERATLLEGRPGDLLYWPESYWHLAVSDGMAPTLSCNWAYINREAPRGEALEVVLRELSHLARERAGDAVTVDSYAFDRRAQQRLLPDAVCSESVRSVLPQALKQGRDSVGALATAASLDDAICRAWLDRATGLGLREVPRARENLGLSERDSVRADPREPIACVRTTDSCLVSANGTTLIAPNDRAVVALIRCLNEGRAHRVGELEQRMPFAGGRGAVGVRLLLEGLAGARALEVEHAPMSEVQR